MSPFEQIAFFTLGAPYRAIRLLLRHLSSGNIGALRGAVRGVRDSVQTALRSGGR